MLEIFVIILNVIESNANLRNTCHLKTNGATKSIFSVREMFILILNVIETNFRNTQHARHTVQLKAPFPHVKCLY